MNMGVTHYKQNDIELQKKESAIKRFKQNRIVFLFILLSIFQTGLSFDLNKKYKGVLNLMLINLSYELGIAVTLGILF
jgi:hypothetical protein